MGDRLENRQQSPMKPGVRLPNSSVARPANLNAVKAKLLLKSRMTLVVSAISGGILLLYLNLVVNKPAMNGNPAYELPSISISPESINLVPRISQSASNEDIDSELLSIWENNKFSQNTDFKIKTQKINNICLIQTTGTSEKASKNWRISSKRNALIQVARYISSLSIEPFRSKEIFNSGQLVGLEYNEGDMTASISFKTKLECSQITISTE